MTARKPAALRVLEGSAAHRPIPNAPLYAPLLDDPPKNLGRAGLAMWRRVCTSLDDTCVLQAPDYFALTALCQQWQLYQTALADITKRGHLVTSARADGDLVKNPSCVIASQALAHFRALAAEFGLSPLSRSRLDVPKPAATEDDPTARAIAVAAARR